MATCIRAWTWRLAVVVAVLMAVAGISTSVQAGTAADSSAGAAGTYRGPQLTGFAASVLTRPSAVRGSDGRLHIAYELVLTGATPFAVDVEQVEVRDAKTHRVLLSLGGDALSSRIDPVGGAPAGVTPPPTTLIGPSGSAVIWLDVPVRRKAGLPGVLEHRIVSSTRPPAGEQSIAFTSLVGRVPLRARSPLKLGPPVRSGIWGAGEGCCDNDTHHRRGLLVVDGNQGVPQRFAIDWMMLDEQHRAWVGDPRRLSSYLSYGQPLIAAAAGKVVEARDGFADQTPPDNPTPPPFADLPGNHVTLRVGPGIYLIYAHMKPGSVRVRVGQRVRSGQLLGKLGNSGQLGHATPPSPGPDHAQFRRRRPAVRLQTLPVSRPDHQPGPLRRDPRPAAQRTAALCPSQCSRDTAQPDAPSIAVSCDFPTKVVDDR